MSHSRWGTILAGTLLVSATVVIALWLVPTPSARSVDAPPLQVAARIGNRTFTVAELDERWKRETPAEHSAAMQRLYDGRSSALDSLLGEILIEGAARSRGMTVPEYLEAEVRQRTKPVGDEEVRTFYEANIDSLNGRPLDGLREAIRSVLERKNRERALAALVADLTPAGPSVRMLLQPPTQTVPVDDTDPSRGGRNAPVTIVAFSDFQCPFCARLEPILEEVHAAYGDTVRVVWKDFPLTSIHPDAFKAAEASHCAAEQRRYWEYHRRLFANQEHMGAGELMGHAAALGLDVGTFSACLESSRYAARVQKSLDAGGRMGVQATPTVFINGRVLHGAQPFSVFSKLIEEELHRGADHRSRARRRWFVERRVGSLSEGA